MNTQFNIPGSLRHPASNTFHCSHDFGNIMYLQVLLQALLRFGWQTISLCRASNQDTPVSQGRGDIPQQTTSF